MNVKGWNYCLLCLYYIQYAIWVEFYIEWDWETEKRFYLAEDDEFYLYQNKDGIFALIHACPVESVLCDVTNFSTVNAIELFLQNKALHLWEEKWIPSGGSAKMSEKS